MIKFTPLFSGSKGNSALVESGNTKVLLDIGYNYKSIIERLARSGVSPDSISAIVITHEHTDHISALKDWRKNFDTPVYAPNSCIEEIEKRTFCSDVLSISESFAVGLLNISCCRLSHDSKCCVGYKFSDGEDTFASVTDTGVASEKVVEFLSGARILQLESNHDVVMLKNGPYPYILKQRILSSHGHLSNEQCGEIVEQVANKGTKIIVLAHLSEKNNTAEIAFSNAVEVLTKNNFVEGRDVKIYIADQYNNEVTFE